MRKKYLEIGKIVSTHGIKGDVKIQPWCDNPDILAQFKVLYFENGASKIQVGRSVVHKNMVLMHIVGVEDMNAAQALRNKVLYVDREDFELDENTYFIQDLIGLKIIDADNGAIVYGELVDVTQTGANDVYHIKNEAGKTVLIPAIPEVIVNTDIDNDVMLIRPLKGLFDDEI